MKILKIFGIVAGIHLFALVVIFANPGCSSTAKRAPQPSDTAAPVITAAPATATSASASPYYTSGGAETTSPSSVSFNPEAPASATASSSTATPDVRFTPTRPGTPVAGTLAMEKVGDVTPVSTYTVQAGDNLGAIARKHGVTIAQLTSANNLNSKSTLKVGQKLMIPAKSAAVTPKGNAAPEKTADAVPAKAASGGGIKHVVKAGESLGVIARIYGVKAGDIAVANHISDPAKIRAGLELVIPGWQATGEKGTTSKKTTTKSSSSTASTPAPVSRAPQSASTSAPAPLEPAPIVERPAQPAPVPVIRIDEGTITAAPKSGN